MKNLSKLLFLALLTGLSFTSCSDDEDNNTDIEGDYAQGVLVLNEGSFGSANASVSFIDKDGVLENNIFNTTNGTGIGDVAQSIGFNNENAYIIVNNSSTIEVVDRYTFKQMATITDQILNPRFIAFGDNKGYVSNWGDPFDTTDDYIALINTTTNTVESKIAVAEGPEAILEQGGKLYVAHKGGYGTGNSISVIDLDSQEIISTITVGYIPDTMVMANGSLFVLSSGKLAWTGEETQGELSKINISDNTISETLTFEPGLHPANLKWSGDKLYYTINTEIYEKGVADALPASSLFSASEASSLYGFGVNNNKIYIGDPNDYASAGKVYVYSTSGALENTYTVGIVPNGFYFNN